MSKTAQTRRPGRPPVFKASLKNKIIALIRKMGLTKTKLHLATIGIQQKGGQPKSKLSISIPTLQKWAKDANIVLGKGRLSCGEVSPVETVVPSTTEVVATPVVEQPAIAA